MELSDGIDLAAYASANAQNYIMQRVSTSMLENAIDMAEIFGSELVQMMERSVNPSVGGNIDIRI